MMSAPNPQASAHRIPLLLLLLLPFAIPIATAWYANQLSLRQGRDSINQVASELRQENTRLIQERLQSFLDEPFLVAEFNASLVQAELVEINQVLDLLPLFWKQMRQFESLTFISVGTQQGHYLDISRSDQGLGIGFRDETTGDGTQQWELDAAGQRTRQVGTNPGYDPRKREWYQDAIAAGQPSWSEIYVTLIPRVQVLSANQPVVDREGNLLGIIAADLDTLGIGQFLAEQEIGRTGQAFIIERSGLLVATSANEDPFVIDPQTEEPQRLLALDSRDPLTQQTMQFLLQQYPDLNQVTTAQQLDFVIEEERLFLEVLPFADGRGVDWLITVVIPESDFLGEIEANYRWVVLTTTGGMLLAVLLGTLAYVWVLQPIRRLNQAAAAMATGQRDQQVAVPRIGQLGPLAESFNAMARQVESSLTTLESKVAERTQELQQANQEILNLNQQLQAENLRMGAELEITRKLQQMILPKDEELQGIPNLEIAGFMEPATEVGGDYYDVLQREGQLTIGIGDVTGHGLESGVLMIMVQTAVRTLQVANIKDPHQFINAINQVIYGNLQRMNSDKNLTLAVLDYHKGVLTLSGQHEEMVVIRKHGEIERVDTLDLGFPVGLEENIAAFISQVQVELAAGDVVVLYTDGITEAENAQREQYGLDRLCEITCSQRHRSAHEIRQVIVEDIHRHIGGFRVFDDITLVVIKQKESLELGVPAPAET